jgi:hypothetical protein
VLEKAPEIITNTEIYLNYHARHRHKFILYNTATDLLQTNIALDIEQYQANQANLATNHRLVLCLAQSRQKLLQDMQQLIAKSMALEMIYDGDFQERIQNSNLIALPDWYINGFASYMSLHWNTQLDNQLHDILKQNPDKNFKYYLQQNPDVFGTAFWFFIDEYYGKNTVANILYLTRTNRDFESALRYALGKGMQTLGKECLDFFAVYQKNYPFFIANNLASTPQKNLTTQNKNGVYSIYLSTNGKKKRIHKSGLKHASFAGIVPQPCVAMHPSKKMVAVFYSKKAHYTSKPSI